MRFLADESCDYAVVRVLREAGYGVVAVADISPRAEDGRVMQLAAGRRSVLITEDKDFGQLVFADRRASRGVILIRYPATARRGLSRDVLELVNTQGARLNGRFVVMQPGRIRIVQPQRLRR
jgi:predicted nuclease of predicted toxin-antitoxin system